MEYIGKKKFYESLDGLAVGKAVKFFSGNDRIKSWGLKDNGKDHNIFSIFHKNDWHTFVRDEGYNYKVNIYGQDRVQILIARGSEKIIEINILKSAKSV